MAATRLTTTILYLYAAYRVSPSLIWRGFGLVLPRRKGTLPLPPCVPLLPLPPCVPLPPLPPCVPICRSQPAKPSPLPAARPHTPFAGGRRRLGNSRLGPSGKWAPRAGPWRGQGHPGRVPSGSRGTQGGSLAAGVPLRRGSTAGA